jgi:hypothetical protein
LYGLAGRHLQIEFGNRWRNNAPAEAGVRPTISLPTPTLPAKLFGRSNESGIPASGRSYRRGVDYFLRTQQDDGTWHVVSCAMGFQPYFQSGFPYGHDQWISQAGTAMATIALTYAANLPGNPGSEVSKHSARSVGL